MNHGMEYAEMNHGMLLQCEEDTDLYSLEHELKPTHTINNVWKLIV